MKCWVDLKRSLNISIISCVISLAVKIWIFYREFHTAHCQRFTYSPSFRLEHLRCPFQYRIRRPEICKFTKDEAREIGYEQRLLSPVRVRVSTSKWLLDPRSPIQGSWAGKFNLVIDSRAHSCRSTMCHQREWKRSNITRSIKWSNFILVCITYNFSNLFLSV